jgi:ribosomal protein L19E
MGQYVLMTSLEMNGSRGRDQNEGKHQSEGKRQGKGQNQGKGKRQSEGDSYWADGTRCDW